jgi:hypothetical protein
MIFCSGAMSAETRPRGSGYFGDHGSPLQSFADNRYENLTPMRGAAMLEQKYPLPGSELHPSIDYRYRFTGARQDHADVRRHVVTAFGTVREVVGIFGNKPFEKLLQIPARCGIGVFHDDYAATCVLDKNGHCSVSDAARVDFLLHFIGNFVQSFSMCANLQLFMTYAHKMYPTKLALQGSMLKGGGLRQ